MFVGDDIELSVLEITGSQVKLGIRAPRELRVLRSEIWVIAEQNRSAAQIAPDSAITQLRRRLADQARTAKRDEDGGPE